VRLGTCYAVSSVGIVLLGSLYIFPLHGDWLAQYANTIRFLAGVILYGVGMVEGMNIQIERRKATESELGTKPEG